MTLVRRSEIDDNLDDYEDWNSYLDAVREYPENLDIYAKVIEGCLEGWEKNKERFVPFPKDGFLALYTKLPSSTHSKKDK